MDALDTFGQMAALLWRGGAFCYYWTPDGREYTDADGNTQREKLTAWRRTETQPRPPSPWLTGKNLYFGVNPTSEIPTHNSEGKPTKPQYLRARNSIVAAVNCLYADLDGKDYVTEAEFLPFYIAPDLDGLSKAKARGALQRAQTAAVDAAYKANPAEYKRRAFAHLTAAPLRASAAWDSGGGYQAVWLLTDTETVTDENREALRHWQRAWVHLLGGDGSASDLARVLRVPGSTNYKPKYAPDFPEVAFLWAELHRRYALGDFRALLPPMEEKPKVERKRVYVPAGAPLELGSFGDVPRLPRHPAIDDYNARTDLRTLLLELGYTDAGGGRMNRPGGDSAGVQLHRNNTASIYSSADPLYCERRVTPALALCVYEHDGSPDKLLTALTGCARPLPPMDEALKWRLLAWAQSAAARDLLRDGYGIRRPDGYLRTIEALVILAAERESWCFVPGIRQIAAACNASAQSISKHLVWFSGTLFQTWRTDRGAAVDLGLLYWVSERHPYAKVDTSPIFADGADAHPYAKVDSAVTGDKQIPVNFSVGGDGADRADAAKNGAAVNLSVGVQFQHDTLAHDAFVPVAYVHGIARRMERTVLLKSLGHAGRVAWAAILETPGISRAEIAQQSGVSGRTLAKTLHQMERLSLVTVEEDAEGAKLYTLAAGALDRLEGLLPHMTSYKTGVRRAELAEGSRAKWLYKQYRETQAQGAAMLRKCGDDADKRAFVARGVSMKLAAIVGKAEKCDKLQTTLRADLLAAGIKPAKGRPQTWLRWDHKEMLREQVRLAADLAQIGGTRADKLRMATMAGWTPNEVMQAMRPTVLAQLPQMAATGD